MRVEIKTLAIPHRAEVDRIHAVALGRHNLLRVTILDIHSQQGVAPNHDSPVVAHSAVDPN
jgi:hypothetical protein